MRRCVAFRPVVEQLPRLDVPGLIVTVPEPPLVSTWPPPPSPYPSVFPDITPEDEARLLIELLVK